MQYATPPQYVAFTGGGSTSDALLKRASATIRRLTLTASYDVDEAGLPTDPAVKQAFADATCAQVAWWDDTDDVTGAESQAGPVKIGSVSLGGSGVGGGASNTRNAATARYAPEAIDILRVAGLLSGIVAHR